MKTIFLASVMTLFCVATAVADVTVSINNVKQTGPTDSSGNVREKVDKDEQASYSLTGSYNGLPPMNAEERVTGSAWEYTISSGSNVTCSPKTGTGNSATFTASSSNSGTYTITITMKVILTITKYKSDMQTVESTYESQEYSKTTTVTLNVWGKLTIAAPDYLPVQSERKEVKITVNTTLTGALTDGTLTLTATDKLKLYVNEEGGTGSNSLNLILTNNAATCYVASGNSPSENASDQTLTATYSGTNVESAIKDLTVYKLTIEAPDKMVDIGNGKFAVPVMFNDDHDCGKEYTADWNCGVNCSSVLAGSKCSEDTHRELEPVWDYLYAGTCENENDLVSVKIDITPTDMAGDVKVKPIGSEKNSKTVFNIRIWENSKKGDKSSIITEKTYSVSELPQTIYVEGIAIGKDSITATYIPPQNKTVEQTKILDIEIVSLIETQMIQINELDIYGKETIKNIPVRKIINENKKPITFTVKGGSDFNGKFAWTESSISPLGISDSITLSFGETGCDVPLPEDAPHRRFTSTVSVSIDDGKLKLSRTIRVAQDNYHGKAVAETLTDRRKEVPTLATLPTMDTMPIDNSVPPNPPVKFSTTDFDSKYGTDFTGNGNAKVRYATGTAISAYGAAISVHAGTNRKVYVAMLLKKAYDDKLRLEDLAAIAEHEARHANQYIWARDGKADWIIIERHPLILDYFMEADAYVGCLRSQANWKIIDHFLRRFEYNYRKAGAEYEKEIYYSEPIYKPRSPNTIKLLNSMRSILQDIYKNIPLNEMKNTEYYNHVRPPRLFKP
ncbi:MAG: hypothetical protein LBK82_15000 [Planctomycetaceae bacterium]|jgi:hypothetical protein|nr:hypothetical protein [Planctomycetaceae bacterium]